MRDFIRCVNEGKEPWWRCFRHLAARKWRYFRSFAYVLTMLVIALAFTAYGEKQASARREGGCALLRVYDTTYGVTFKAVLENAIANNEATAKDPHSTRRERTAASASAERYKQLLHNLKPLADFARCPHPPVP